jgi:flagellar biosynthesis protein FlhF
MGAEPVSLSAGSGLPVEPRIVAQEATVIDPIQLQIDALSNMVRELYAKREKIWEDQPPVVPMRPSTDALEKHLRRVELPDDLVRECLIHAERMGIANLEPNEPVVVDSMTAFLADKLSVAPVHGGEREILSFVGPPGCGKTTTLAKLASIASAQEARKVAIVTLDTYRVGAAEQLRAYASILDVPFEIAYTPTQLDQALKRQADADMVLIDTAGRCALDEKRVGQLGLFLNHRSKIQLVLGVDLRDGVIARSVNLLGALECDGVVLTKLDSATRLGVLAGICRQLPVPVRYLATGPDVPGDLIPAERALIARLSLGYSRLEPASSLRMAAA